MFGSAEDLGVDQTMALLEVARAEVRFGGLHALRGADLAVAEGAVTGLIGPNGAGKTTLFNVICGLQGLSSGSVRLDGRDLRGVRPHRRARLGIARTFQRLEVFGSLSVAENVLAAAEIRRRWARDRSDVRAVTAGILELTGLRQVAGQPADTLPTGQARLLELARALATRPRLLLLDEPSSGLDEQETDELGDLLTRLAGAGMAVLLVEHDMELVMRVCGTISVLDFGAVLATGPPAEVRADPRVQAAYLGTENDAEEGAATAGLVTEPVGA